MPHDSAWSVLNNLGGVNSISFIDQNDHIPSFSRLYANYLRRCEDQLSAIREVDALCDQFDIEIGEVKDPKDLLELLNKILEGRQQAEHTYFDNIEQNISTKIAGIKTYNRNYQQLNDQINSLKEYKSLLELIKPFIPENFK